MTPSTAESAGGDTANADGFMDVFFQVGIEHVLE